MPDISPLAVYENFLARADRVPLLVEIVRRYAPGEFGPLLSELIRVRGATEGIVEPSDEKLEKERELGEVLERALGEFSSHEILRKTPIFVKLLGEFREWSQTV